MKNIKAVALLLALASLVPLARAEDDPNDRSKLPIEVDTTDPKLTKIVLVAGRPSHGPGDHEFFAGSVILFNMLKQTPGVFPVLCKDGWPTDPKIFEGAKSLVFYMDGRGGHPIVKQGHMDLVQQYIDKGVGFVNLHYAVDYEKGPGQRILKWMGGYYDAEISINPHWEGDFKALPAHPITSGVEPFKIKDEWYYNMRWIPEMKGVTPILKATPPDTTRGTPDSKRFPGREEITAWAFEREDGGRAFGFTGGHTHKNWSNDNFRRLVVNAILWTAKVEIPKEGAKVEMAPDDINRYLDAKGKKK